MSHMPRISILVRLEPPYDHEPRWWRVRWPTPALRLKIPLNYTLPETRASRIVTTCARHGAVGEVGR